MFLIVVIDKLFLKTALLKTINAIPVINRQSNLIPNDKNYPNNQINNLLTPSNMSIEVITPPPETKTPSNGLRVNHCCSKNDISAPVDLYIISPDTGGD